jgi:N-acetylglucosaminyl-diphospho-decaprenol L-rhamnosyltransferase
MQDHVERVSVFVLHWNQPRECLETIRQLREQDERLDLTVIDNNSAPAALDELQAGLDPIVKFLRLPQNRGWGAALNVALRDWLIHSPNPFCVISAHDVTPTKNCVELLMQAMKNDAQIGLACPQYEKPTVPRFSAIHGVQEHVEVEQSRGSVQLLEVPHGTLMLVRRECLADIGLFDERYFAYGDEHELGARATRRGWKVALVWGAVVRNRGTFTPSAWRSYLLARNSLLLVNDHRGRVAAWLRALVLVGNTLRFAVWRNADFAFSTAARLKAVRDYFLGRFGPPPTLE